MRSNFEKFAIDACESTVQCTLSLILGQNPENGVSALSWTFDLFLEMPY